MQRDDSYKRKIQQILSTLDLEAASWLTLKWPISSVLAAHFRNKIKIIYKTSARVSGPQWKSILMRIETCEWVGGGMPEIAETFNFLWDDL